MPDKVTLRQTRPVYRGPLGKQCAVKKGVYLILDDEEVIELSRILMDDDAPAALAFLENHLKGKVHELLEGG